MPRLLVLTAALAGVAAVGKVAAGEVDPLVPRAVQLLKSQATSLGTGESALVAIALIKADVPTSDPALAQCLGKARARFATAGYAPERTGGAAIYEAGVTSIALASLAKEDHKRELQAVADYLLRQQNPNGSWDYPGRPQGDTSISQYAVLGLWEAENSGARVPAAVWDRAAAWFLSVQSGQGSWNYHRDEPNRPETLSMTAAGVGSLLICQRQLARYRSRRAEVRTPLLVPLNEEAKPTRYTPSTSNATFDAAIQRGGVWLGSSFRLAPEDPLIGMSVYYALYGIERAGALAGKAGLGGVDWFDKGRQFLAATQRASGGWSCNFESEAVNTAWAVLFLTRATAKTLKRIEIKRLGAGTLLGGRGLPKDLSSLTVAGGRVVARPMNGAVENMLAVLEDPRALDNADSALAGLVDRYQREGPQALRPFKDRFHKMLTDRDPGLRRVAAWSLARTGELDVVPWLIGALNDPEPDVVATAGQGLRLLSRKIDGYGPPPNPSPEERSAAVEAWRRWYQAIRPLDLEGQDDDVPTAPARRPR
jgi:hypothetical protein